MVKTNIIMQEIAQGVSSRQYEHCGDWFMLPTGDWLHVNDFSRLIARELSDPKPSNIKAILELIRLKDPKNQDLWNIFQAKSKSWNGKEPLLFNLWNDKETQKAVKTLVASVLQGKSPYCWFMQGEPECGKSIIIKALHNVFGDQFSYTKQLSSLNSDFGLSGLEGKLFMYADDLGVQQLSAKSSGVFKTLITGGKVEINVKNQKQRMVDLNLNCVFAMNSPVYVDIYDTGNLRRIIAVRFGTKDKIPKMTTDEYNYLMTEIEADTENLKSWAMSYEIDNTLIEFMQTVTLANLLKQELQVLYNTHNNYLQYIASMGMTANDLPETNFNAWLSYLVNKKMVILYDRF